MADFWQNPNLEPKRAYKFVLSIPGGAPGVAIPKFLVKKVSKPAFSITESSHKFLNHTFYFPGKVEYETVSFTIVDVIGQEDGTAAVMKLFQAMGYQLPEAPPASPQIAPWMIQANSELKSRTHLEISPMCHARKSDWHLQGTPVTSKR